MNKPLLHKIALVTGASRGIGAAIAKRLAADGAEVILHYGSGATEAQAVAAEIRAAGGKASTVQADLAAADGPAKLAEAVSSPRIDILVNNAGVALFAGVDTMSEADFDRQANVNMRSLFFITQKLLPRIPDGGRIINLASAVTRIAFPGIPAYAATKGFVDVLTLQLAAELGKRNITVNAVAPGAIDTQMSSWIHGPGGHETVAQIQALPGIGQPAHVAGVVGFLAGPDGAWTTGQIVDVSGGTKL
ncbi:short-chain dehydrogenase [beta proteobacterium AAP99]|nr:short-chain dehydrogenase [beta proteobacterium AAP99]